MLKKKNKKIGGSSDEVECDTTRCIEIFENALIEKNLNKDATDVSEIGIFANIEEEETQENLKRLESLIERNDAKLIKEFFVDTIRKKLSNFKETSGCMNFDCEFEDNPRYYGDNLDDLIFKYFPFLKPDYVMEESEDEESEDEEIEE